jgi:hypothetical protein
MIGCFQLGCCPPGFDQKQSESPAMGMVVDSVIYRCIYYKDIIKNAMVVAFN